MTEYALRAAPDQVVAYRMDMSTKAQSFWNQFTYGLSGESKDVAYGGMWFRDRGGAEKYLSAMGFAAEFGKAFVAVVGGGIVARALEGLAGPVARKLFGKLADKAADKLGGPAPDPAHVENVKAQIQERLETEGENASRPQPVEAPKSSELPPNNGIPASTPVLARRAVTFEGADWRQAGKSLAEQYPGKSICYVLKDAKTDEILKVGVDKIDALPSSWQRYKNAQALVSHRQLTLEANVVESNSGTVKSIEKQMHQAFTDRGHALPWDNDYPQGRLGRPGPGVPGVRDSRLVKKGWQWVQKKPGTDPVYEKVSNDNQ